MLAEYLLSVPIMGKTVDIGTGETGILAHCLRKSGASSVLATDVDASAISWAQRASPESSGIDWRQCNLIPDDLREGCYDLIVSNPPQMPMPTVGSAHDYGGEDGRLYVLKIMETAGLLLTSTGKLVMLTFDFLGISDGCGQESLSQIGARMGFETRIISAHRRYVRSGGQTERNIEWIRSVYRGYNLKTDTSGENYHEIFLLEMSRGKRA